MTMTVADLKKRAMSDERACCAKGWSEPRWIAWGYRYCLVHADYFLKNSPREILTLAVRIRELQNRWLLSTPPDQFSHFEAPY